jgi:hypothetical protein
MDLIDDLLSLLWGKINLWESIISPTNRMSTYVRLIAIFDILRNSVRIFLEVSILGLSSINAASESFVYLRTHASASVVIERLITHPLILSIIALSIIDIKFDYTQQLRKETRLSHSKSILASEVPHIILKILFMAWANIQFLGVSGMVSGIEVLAFYLFDRVKPISQIFSFIFGRNDSLILPAKIVKWGLGLSICATLTMPTLWIGAEWFTQRKLPIDFCIIFPVFNIFILKSLFRILKSNRPGFENL